MKRMLPVVLLGLLLLPLCSGAQSLDESLQNLDRLNAQLELLKHQASTEEVLAHQVWSVVAWIIGVVSLIQFWRAVGAVIRLEKHVRLIKEKLPEIEAVRLHRHEETTALLKGMRDALTGATVERVEGEE